MQVGYRLGTRQLQIALRRETATRFEVTSESGVRLADASVLDAQTIQLTLDGRQHLAHVVRIGDARHVWIAGQVYVLAAESSATSSHAALAPPQIVAPMPGKVLEVLVETGQQVAEGDGLVILEAMKMEHRITAAAAARVTGVHVQGGQMVDGGVVLIELEYAGET